MTHLREKPQSISLGKAYAQNKGKPIAYLDETYRSRADKPAEDPFYVFTAVIVAAEEVRGLTLDLIKIVDGDYWHTSESLKTEFGREKTLELCDYLGDGSEPCVIACKMEGRTGKGDAEEMRRACLLGLLEALSKGGPGWPQVQLMVMERRRTTDQVSIDQHTMTLARQQKLVSRHAQLVQVSPSLEPLLWLPDLVSSATRQKMVHGDSTYYNGFANLVHEVHVP